MHSFPIMHRIFLLHPAKAALGRACHLFSAALLLFFAGATHAAGDLIAYWPMNETSGSTVADTGGSGNTGTITGAGVTQSTSIVAPLTCGTNPASLSFSGSNGYVNIPSNSGMEPASAISMSVWIRPNDLGGGHRHIIFKQGPTLTSYGIWQLADRIYIETNPTGGTRYAATSSPVLTANQWTHLVFTFDGTRQIIYINGTQNSSQPVTPPPEHPIQFASTAQDWPRRLQRVF